MPLFGATFFGITGLHMTARHDRRDLSGDHGRGLRQREFDADDVEVSGLYWHFVDLVWMFVFPMIYLMSINLKG